MKPEDFLCDYCRRAWDGTFPMVEGHQGSLICGECLSAAYRALVLHEGDGVGPGLRCAMCLEERAQAEWRGSAEPGAIACERCIRQAAQSLSKDPDWEWTRPA